MYAGVPSDVPSCVSVDSALRRARRADRFRDAEIRHRRRAAGEQHVVGLDVAVHDAVFVRVGERARHVAQNAHDVAQRQRTLRRAARAATRLR